MSKRRKVVRRRQGCQRGRARKGYSAFVGLRGPGFTRWTVGLCAAGGSGGRIRTYTTRARLNATRASHEPCDASANSATPERPPGRRPVVLRLRRLRDADVAEPRPTLLAGSLTVNESRALRIPGRDNGRTPCREMDARKPGATRRGEGAPRESAAGRQACEAGEERGWREFLAVDRDRPRLGSRKRWATRKAMRSAALPQPHEAGMIPRLPDGES